MAIIFTDSSFCASATVKISVCYYIKSAFVVLQILKVYFFKLYVEIINEIEGQLSVLKRTLSLLCLLCVITQLSTLFKKSVIKNVLIISN